MSDRSLAFVVPEELRGERLDRVLERLVPDRSRAWLQKLVRRGGVRLDGRPIHRSNVRVRGGERLSVDGERPRGAVRSERSLAVLHEDDHLIAVDKPASLLTHAAPGSDEDSLAVRLVARYGELPSRRGEERPGIVHRLDRETSGVLLAARTERAMEALTRAFREHRVAKRYLALVHGVPEVRELVVDLPLAPQRGAGDRERVAPPGTGKDARTRFRLEEALGHVGLLLCEPETGRRHQIRVHAAEAGHPVLFDKLYRGPGRAELPPGAPLLRRHALHALELALEHPITGEELVLRAPPAPDFAALLAWLREHRA